MVVIACHIGAGELSYKREKEYTDLMKNALNYGQSLVKKNCDLENIVVEVIELTNAGKGSNRTADGNVECESSIMTSKLSTGYPFASVGAVTVVKNPIKLAKALLDYSSSPEARTNGRSPPLCLVGKGADDFALQTGIETIKRNSELFTDENGFVVTATSSGGVSLKLPGRLGPYGCGCWSQQKGMRSIGSCSTGRGEDLILTRIASFITETVLGGNLEFTESETLFKEFFYQSIFFRDRKPEGGILLLHQDKESGLKRVIAFRLMYRNVLSCILQEIWDLPCHVHIRLPLIF
ncbi:N-terminal nucleophile aminohydrolase, partial [Rozella allomycis CSF55]